MLTLDLRRWIARSPHPASLRCDGELVAVGTGKRRWAEAARAVEAQGAAMVEALDAKGAVLRVLELGDPEGSLETPPKGDLAELARVLSDVADRAVARHADAYSLAFSKQLELVELLAARLGSLEQTWATMVERRAEEVATAGNGALDSEAQGLLAHIVASRMGGAGKGTNSGPG